MNIYLSIKFSGQKIGNHIILLEGYSERILENISILQYNPFFYAQTHRYTSCEALWSDYSTLSSRIRDHPPLRHHLRYSKNSLELQEYSAESHLYPLLLPTRRSSTMNTRSRDCTKEDLEMDCILDRYRHDDHFPLPYRDNDSIPHTLSNSG